jgi:hypothetical protein
MRVCFLPNTFHFFVALTQRNINSDPLLLVVGENKATVILCLLQ